MTAVIREIDVTGNLHGGGFIECNSGVRFDILNPKNEDIIVADIALALSKQCRYAGHTNRFYSVAEHCCHVHDLIERAFGMFMDSGTSGAKLALAGLMHDASEAYLVDLPRPLKPLVTNYHQLETTIMDAIRRKFDIVDSEAIHKAIKLADNLVLRAEAEVLMPSKGEGWGWTPDIVLLDSIKIECWSPDHAAAEFLERLCQYI